MVLAALVLATLPVLAARNVELIAPAGPHFALTFDAHTEAEGATELLALLKERGVRVTLFVTGSFALAHPDLLQQAADDGHEIGNHTFTHPHLTSWASNRRHDTLPEITRARLHDELRRTAAAIEASIGAPPAPLWRAPYGEHNRRIRGWAEELGLVHVDWTRGGGTSLDALDWVEDPRARAYLSPEAMARRLLSFTERSGVPLAGSIVLMHLGSGRPDPPLLEALPIFLDETDRLGLSPIPVGELLERAEGATP